MKLSNSSWDSEGKFRLNSASVVFGYGNSKILPANPDLNTGRDRLISETYSGGEFDSISGTYIPLTITQSDTITVLGHGVLTQTGLENCVSAGTDCSGGGTDTQCPRGKCRIGEVSATGKRGKWRYDSLTVGDLFYYVWGESSIKLKSISRGYYTLPAGVGEIAVNRVASIPSTIYLPPSSYNDETFTRRVIVKRKSLEDSLDSFLRVFLDNKSPFMPKEGEVQADVIESVLEVVDPVWESAVREGLGAIVNVSNRDFLIQAYEFLSGLYGSYAQVAGSSVAPSSIQVDEISRPIYNRLPGIAGAYNSEEGETPARWLVSGADNYLSKYKSQLDNYYQTYLNPQTCLASNLDWIAQHLGLTRPFWNTEWPTAIKRKLIANAHTSTLEGSESNLDRLDLSIIEQVLVSGNNVSTGFRYGVRTYDEGYSLVLTNTLNVAFELWRGILPSRGSLVTLLALFSIFGIKAFSAEELEFRDGDFFVKSGLRVAEENAPINTPYMVDRLRVGDEIDLEVNNFPNQLIAGAKYYDADASNRMVVRVPFYYNRNGRSWDSVQRILDYCAPATVVSRLQYAYPAAGLLVAGDIFFEPQPL